MATPTSHESIMSGMFAGHEAVYNKFKKAICCAPTEEEQVKMAEDLQEKLEAITL